MEFDRIKGRFGNNRGERSTPQSGVNRSGRSARGSDTSNLGGNERANTSLFSEMDLPRVAGQAETHRSLIRPPWQVKPGRGYTGGPATPSLFSQKDLPRVARQAETHKPLHQTSTKE